jgi:hypothetical protein
MVWFLPSPGKWAGVSCHDKVVQMTESRYTDASCHVTIKIVQMGMQKPLLNCLDCPYWGSVSVAGFVMGYKLKLIK